MRRIVARLVVEQGIIAYLSRDEEMGWDGNGRAFTGHLVPQEGVALDVLLPKSSGGCLW